MFQGTDTNESVPVCVVPIPQRGQRKLKIYWKIEKVITEDSVCHHLSACSAAIPTPPWSTGAKVNKTDGICGWGYVGGEIPDPYNTDWNFLNGET